MPDKQRHIIQKSILEIDLRPGAPFHVISQAWKQQFYADTLPALSQRLDELVDPAVRVSLERVEVNLGKVDWHENERDWGSVLAERIIEALKQQLVAAPYDGVTQTDEYEHPTPDQQPVELQVWQIWAYYLHEGVLPWYATTPGKAPDWEKQLLQTRHHNAVGAFIDAVLADPAGRARLIAGFSDGFIFEIFGQRNGGIPEQAEKAFSVWRKSIGLLLQYSQATRDAAWQTLLTTAGRDTPVEALLVRMFDRLFVTEKSAVLSRLFQQPTILPPKPRAGANRHAGTGSNLFDTILRAAATSATPAAFWQKIQTHTHAPVIRANFSAPALAILLALEKPDGKAGMGRLEEAIEPTLPPAPADAPETIAADAFDQVKAIDPDQTGSDVGKEAVEEAVSAVFAKSQDQGYHSGVHADHAGPVRHNSKRSGAEEIYLANAGLVLLHPFLPALFDASGLLTPEKYFIDDAARREAIRLTGYLASGQPDTPDWELALPKVLCGADPEEIMAVAGLPLMPTLTEEAEGLLRAAIGHWTALGQLSPDGLREAFLRRPGKLGADTAGWLLQVEAATIDVLLSRLPWGYGVVKLPWMLKPIWVNWL